MAVFVVIEPRLACVPAAINKSLKIVALDSVFVPPSSKITLLNVVADAARVWAPLLKSTVPEFAVNSEPLPFQAKVVPPETIKVVLVPPFNDPVTPD